MAITQAELARSLGVSQGTISYAFRQDSRINSGTRQRILESARKLGYLPNAAARSLVKKQVRSVGLVTSTVSSQSALGDALNGIHAALDELNLHLVVAQLPDPKLTDAQFVPRILRELAVAGLLIGYTHNTPPGMEELIRQYHIPAIWINSKYNQNCVYPDDIAAGRMATEHLLALGHRRIGYITYYHTDHYSHTDRYEGYRQAMQAAGLSPLDLRSGRIVWSYPDMLAHSQHWLQGQDRPTALIAYEAEDANHVLIHALTAGLRIPHDLSIIALGRNFLNAGGIRISGIRFSATEMGRQAITLLMRRIANPAVEQPAIALPCVLEQRNSIAPPRAHA